MLQFCKFAPEAQENFAIFSLKYGHKAIQNGGRAADGGRGLGPPSPPRSATAVYDVIFFFQIPGDGGSYVLQRIDLD